MASITRCQQTCNEHELYLSLVTRNMGSSKWEKLTETAEAIFSSRIWNGKNTRYPIKIHIARHREAYNDLERASHHIMYVPPNETSRVRYLLNSIQTNDPMTCSEKTTIQANATNKNNFEEAADFIIITAPKDTVQKRPHNISGLGSKRNQSYKKGKIRTVPTTGVELRFYKKDEWRNLSQEQKDECVGIRTAEKNDRNKGTDGYKSKIAMLEATINDINHKILAMSSNIPHVPTNDVPPPPPSAAYNNPLQPLTGFTQR